MSVAVGVIGPLLAAPLTSPLVKALWVVVGVMVGVSVGVAVNVVTPVFVTGVLGVKVGGRTGLVMAALDVIGLFGARPGVGNGLKPIGVGVGVSAD